MGSLADLKSYRDKLQAKKTLALLTWDLRFIS